VTNPTPGASRVAVHHHAGLRDLPRTRRTAPAGPCRRTPHDRLPTYSLLGFSSRPAPPMPPGARLWAIPAPLSLGARSLRSPAGGQFTLRGRPPRSCTAPSNPTTQQKKILFCYVLWYTALYYTLCFQQLPFVLVNREPTRPSVALRSTRSATVQLRSYPCPPTAQQRLSRAAEACYKLFSATQSISLSSARSLYSLPSPSAPLFLLRNPRQRPEMSVAERLLCSATSLPGTAQFRLWMGAPVGEWAPCV